MSAASAIRTPDKQVFIYEGARLAAAPVNGKVKLRVLVDRGSIELFANDGAAVFDRLAAYRNVSADDVKRTVTKYLRHSRRTR